MSPVKFKVIVGSINIVVGLGWIVLYQMMILTDSISVVSVMLDKIDHSRENFSRFELIDSVMKCARMMSDNKLIILYPILPIAIGFFMIGYALAEFKLKSKTKL